MNLIHINTLLELIINRYFNSYCILVLTDNVSKIQYRSEKPVVHLRMTDDKLDGDKIFRHYGCQDIIISHRKPQLIFREFEKLIRLTKTDEKFNKRKYVIIEGPCNENFTNFFNLPELNFVADVLVIVGEKSGNKRENFEEPHEIYNLTTHSYNGKGFGVLDRWFSGNRSFLLENNLFPDKLGDQKGRELKIGTFMYMPFAVFDPPGKVYDGVEMRFVQELAKLHHMNASYPVINGQWGEVYENWTGVGLFGALAADEADVGFAEVLSAALYQWVELYYYFDYSAPIIRAGVTCLVPAPVLADGLLTPVLSFSPKIWAVLTITVVLSVSALTLISSIDPSEQKMAESWVESLDFSVTTILRIYLLQSLQSFHERKIIRYLTGIILLQVLLVSSLYSSGLASVMTIPRYKNEIKTVQDLASSGIAWGGTTDVWLYSMKDFQEAKYRTILKTFKVITIEGLNKKSHTNNFGFIMERLTNGYFSLPEYVKRDVIENFRQLQEDLYWEYCIFMLRKHSVLLPKLNNLILRIAQAGLEAYWESEVVALHMDASSQRILSYNSHNNADHDTIKLKLAHVEGAFAMFLLGHVLATLCFLAERCLKPQVLVQAESQR